MAIFTDDFSISTEGENSFSNITGMVRGSVKKSGINTGLAHAFVLSTTSALIICEDEGGLLQDIVARASAYAPDGIEYRHNMAWDDDNGRSHVKATLFRQDLSIPVRGGDLQLGTWQSLFLLEFDVRPRNRKLTVTVSGE